MRRLSLLFIFLLGVTWSYAQSLSSDSVAIDYGNPKHFRVHSIVTSGTKYLDESVLLSIAGIAVGDSIEIPGDKISKAIENLWKQGLFSDVKIVAARIQGESIDLELQLQERPRLSKFSFKGISKSDADKIREKINLERDKVVTENVINSSANTVKEYFIEKGYLDVTVVINEVKDTTYTNREILEIVVDKKSIVRIHRIIFKGNKAFVEGHLKHVMKDTKEKRWWKIFTSGKFIDSKYQDDKKKIIAGYNDKGYRDAKIVSDSIYRYGENSLEILINIDEGHQYFFRNITWVGNTKHSSQELNSILGIKKGDRYDQSILDERLFMSQNNRDVSSLYMDDGYLFFSVTPVEINVESDSIDFEMRVYEGKQARINKVTVSGNTKTNDKVIMREIRTKPGELFSRADIIRTQRELAQLGYFDQEKLGVNPRPNPVDGTVDIEYTVEEKPSDQLELSGGYGANQLVGTLGLSFNNFSANNFFKKDAWHPLPSGDGQRLSLRAQTNGKYYQSYNASFTEPWLGGKKPNSFTVSIYHSIQTNGLSKENPLRQSIYITGVSFGLGKRLKVPDDYFTSYTEISYQYYLLDHYNGSFLFNNGTSNNLSFLQTIARNSIDAPIYPRSGSNISLTLQLTPPYSMFNSIDYRTAPANVKYHFIEYHKWNFLSSWFTKIAGNLVLNTRIQYGFLGLYNREVGISPFERFYLGGDGLSGYSLDGRDIIALRGYENASLTPRDQYGQQVGGTIFDKYTVELRFPVSLNPSATIYLLTFAEAGNSWLQFKDFVPFSSYRSVGAGIRIFLPIFGLLGLDWGHPFDDVPFYQTKNRIHFTIGQQF